MAENPYPIPMPHVKLGKPGGGGDLPGEGEYAEVQKQFQQVPRGKRVLQKENKGETLADIDQEFGIDDHDNENNNLLEDSIRVKVKSNLSKPRKRDSQGLEEEEEVFDERDQPETESATPDDTWCSFWDPHSQDVGAQFRKIQTNRLLSARQQQQSIPRMTPRQRRQTLLALEKSLRPVSGLAPKASYVQHTPMTFAKAYPISSTPPGGLSNRDYETHNNLLHQSLANSNMIVTKKYTSREEYGELRPATASERVKAARDASNTTGGGGSSTSKPPQASTDDSDHWNYLKQRRSVTSVTPLSQHQQRPPSCSIRSSLVNSSTNMIPTHPQNYQLDPIRLSRRPSSSFPLISTSSMAQLFRESNIPRYDSINSSIPNTTTTTASMTPRRSYVDYLFGATTASAAAADYYPATIEDEGMLRISRLNLDSAGSCSRPSNILRRSKTSLGVYY
ncbi:hypothetical protein BDR26DRAFT_854169 [Obelidium mucronatum]|nr:hypothetical protein BDR26DRAFT_854169 [Obelidium mucronatum]